MNTIIILLLVVVPLALISRWNGTNDHVRQIKESASKKIDVLTFGD